MFIWSAFALCVLFSGQVHVNNDRLRINITSVDVTLPDYIRYCDESVQHTLIFHLITYLMRLRQMCCQVINNKLVQFRRLEETKRKPLDYYLSHNPIAIV